MDPISADCSVSIEASLRGFGFLNITEIMETARFDNDGTTGETPLIHLADPSLNPNGISFDFIAGPGADGVGYHIFQITASKAFRSLVHSGKKKIVQQSYVDFSGIPPKEHIIHEMLLQIRHERNKLELLENRSLRKQLMKMGFDYDRLVAGAYEITTEGSEFKHLTVVHEELPLVGDRPQNPKYLSFVFHLKRLPKKAHHLDAIYTAVNQGRPADYMSGPRLEYKSPVDKFPTKLEMIANLSRMMPPLYPSPYKAHQLFDLITQVKEGNPRNVPSSFHRKTR